MTGCGSNQRSSDALFTDQIALREMTLIFTRVFGYNKRYQQDRPITFHFGTFRKILSGAACREIFVERLGLRVVRGYQSSCGYRGPPSSIIIQPCPRSLGRSHLANKASLFSLGKDVPQRLSEAKTVQSR